MIQYLIGNPEVIYTKTGELRKVRDFRKRVRYSNDETFIATLYESEELRTDRLSERLLGDAFLVGDIIDVNETDVLSLVAMDTVYYYKAL